MNYIRKSKIFWLDITVKHLVYNLFAYNIEQNSFLLAQLHLELIQGLEDIRYQT